MSERAIKVERGIPIPPTTSGQHAFKAHKRGAKKYPVYTMEVGDSFFVSWAEYRGANSCVYKHVIATGKKFVHRIVDGGIRYWRIK